jgi:hypothetical protein
MAVVDSSVLHALLMASSHRSRRDRSMKALLTIIGVAALVAGLVFMGQGSGYFPYPPESFMVDQTAWVYYGAIIAAIGLLIVIVAQLR